MSRNPLKLHSPRTIKSSQSKLKKRGFALFLVASASTLAVNYYKTEIDLYYEKNPRNNDIVHSCRELTKKEFKTTWYLPTAFLQCIYGAKFDPVPYIPFERELLKFEDGGDTALDWGPVMTIDEKEDTRVLFILHGLTGGSEANYMRHAVINGQKNSYRTVIFNHRGIAHNPLKTPEYHDLADLSDIRAAIKHVKEKYPKAPLYGMGISFGANMLVKYAGETQEKCELQAIVSIANPYDLEKCSDEISKPWKFIYHMNLLRNFKRNLRNNYEMMSKNPKIDIDDVLKSKTIKEYDEKFSIKLRGYKSIEDFYNKAGCVNLIDKIKVPILFINSLDDPVIDKSVIPYEKISKSSNLILMTTHRGGHIDWITNKWRKRWVFWPAMEYLNYMDAYVYPRKEVKSDEPRIIAAIEP